MSVFIDKFYRLAKFYLGWYIIKDEFYKYKRLDKFITMIKASESYLGSSFYDKRKLNLIGILAASCSNNPNSDRPAST